MNKPFDHFADLTSDLDSGAASVAVESTDQYLNDVRSHALAGHGSRSKSAPAPMVPCSRCGGRGVYAGYGTCFKCGGSCKEKGLRMDPKSVASREKAAGRRQAVQQQKQADKSAAFVAWVAAHEAVYVWIKTKAASSTFASSLSASLTQYGSLTANQIAAVERIIESDKDRQAQQEAARATQLQAAPSVQGEGFSKLTEAFQRAKQAGLKHPKVQIGELVFSLASDTSSNHGHLYVKAGRGFEAPYCGKITPAAQFLKGRDCTAEQAEQIVKIGRDPLAEAIAHGKATGRCACCGRELSDPVSIERGLGPLCEENFFG